MVQVLKKETKEAIITAARAEFLEHGFLNASMRRISKDSGVTLSNIYNYFDNKDAIVMAVVGKTIDKLENISKFIKDKGSSNYLKFDKSEAYFDQIVDFLYDHRENLKLIAYSARGSSIEAYVDKWIDDYGNFEYKSLRNKAKSHKEIFQVLPSEFFLKSLTSYFFRAVLELVNKAVNENMPKKKLEKHVDELFGFVYQGWDYYLV